MLRVKSPPLVPTTWVIVTLAAALMAVDPPSCGAHMIVVSDVHAVDMHTAASDAVGLRSQIPKFMPLKVKLVPLPRLAGAFAAAEPIVSTGAAVRNALGGCARTDADRSSYCVRRSREG
jgi:hypothetical protein